ncbi:MAG: crossover junction endodeoxyribonuclease RuvC [Lewinella sp.]|nr:crossover junction endodeoxyribonuclease RuvC [Lewinella sp.]
MPPKAQKKDESYRLLGVDPGTQLLGFALIEVSQRQITLVEMGVIRLHKFPTHEERLQRIYERLQQVIRTHRPRAMAIEAPFYGKNPQSMLKLGRAQGVAIACAMMNGLDVTEYSPRKIKQAIAGNGNAAKEQVAAMLEHELQLDLSDQLLDATDALATAVCHYHQSRHAGIGGKQYSGWEAFLKDNPERMKK